MTDGIQTYVQNFSVTVEPDPALQIEEKLVKTPPAEIEVFLGKSNEIKLGEFQGPKTDKIFASYEVKSTSPSDDTLAKAFVVTSSYASERLTLKVDLSNIDPLFIDSKVAGELKIMTLNENEIKYDIGFKLTCETGSAYCAEVVKDGETTGNAESAGGEGNQESGGGQTSIDSDEEDFEDEFFDDDFEDEEEAFREEEEYGDYGDEDDQYEEFTEEAFYEDTEEAFYDDEEDEEDEDEYDEELDEGEGECN